MARPSETDRIGSALVGATEQPHFDAVTPERDTLGMCMKCDGYSDEEIDRWLELTILTHGWAIQGVLPSDEPDQPAEGWAYTIGAIESHGLAEMVITDTDFDDAAHVLNWAVEFLRDGGTLDGLEADQILWAPVHDDYLTSELFHSYWKHYGYPPQPGRVIQLFPSNHQHCAQCVRDGSTDLSLPPPPPGAN